MVYVIVLASLTVCCALVCAVAQVLGKYPVKFAFKTAASVMFVLTALVALRVSGNIEYGVLILVALVFGLLGDVFLSMDPFVKDKKSQGYFYIIGGASFAIGHIFYIVVFFTLAPLNPWTLFMLVALPALTLFLTTAKVRKTHVVGEDGVTVTVRKPIMAVGKLAIAFTAYSCVLGLMLTSTLNVYLASPGTHGLLLLLAAVFFSISDTALALNDFAKLDIPGKKYFPFVVMLFYYAAQAMFALTIAL